MIAASKEEQCNYLLCVDVDNRMFHTYRLSRISALYTTSDSFTPDESDRAKLLNIARRNPQSTARNIDAAVELTDRGIHRFRLIVKNRPDVLKKEGNIYYFNWPKDSLEDYFRRFGYDAVFISPEECRELMKTFYGRSLEAYTKRRPSH